MKVLLTGATGFVGSHLLKNLPISKTVLLGRTKPHYFPDEQFLESQLDSSSIYSKILSNVNVVIHLAARVHIMDDMSERSFNKYRNVNTLGTLNLAKQAFEAGVKRFIFISSIKVHGESTIIGKPFKSNDTFDPGDCYGQSKCEAELELLKFGQASGLEIVIIRPPLVYGPGVKANFYSLMNLVFNRLPIPFGCITKNKRSLVFVKNLVDLIITCIDHPKAKNQCFLVSDDYDVSTNQIVTEMAKALNTFSLQFPIPIRFYKLAGRLFNKSDVVDRLIGSLQVDISHTKDTLDWKPPHSLQEGFKETAQAFLQSKINNGR